MENMILPLAACILALKRIQEQVKQDGLRTSFFLKKWDGIGREGGVRD